MLKIFSKQSFSYLLLSAIKTGKLANKFISQGKSVLLVAADIYRPGAVKQLNVLAQKIKAPVFESTANDPKGFLLIIFLALAIIFKFSFIILFFYK